MEGCGGGTGDLNAQGQGGEARDRFCRCWHCNAPFRSGAIRKDGVLHSRSERYGGPYWHFSCPACGVENRCEQTRCGTYFASPPFTPSLLEYLLGQLIPHSGELFLKAAAWYQRQAQRRRYVFERDGDFRYSSLWERIKWYLRRREVVVEMPQEPAEVPIPSPYAILGVQPGAAREEVKRAFRRLAKRCHPDKVHHLGPEAEREAHRRFRELVQAYEELIGGGR